tara:strand:- start:68 stop:847 length:780 start_codon:yes stop_codon:yes gene_type:complete
MKDTTFSNKDILITGCASGLGKAFSEVFPGALNLTRQNREDIVDSCRGKKLKAIIHCAFNSSRDENIEHYSKYLDDNLFLTKELLNLECDKFVYISSIDVYRQEFSYYKLCKLLSEILVEESKGDENCLILRCPAILGKTMRSNSILKVLDTNKDANHEITLSRHSAFNCVLQDDIIEFVKRVLLGNEAFGIIDFVSEGNISLEGIRQLFNRDSSVVFGQHEYVTPGINNREIVSFYPESKKSSAQVISEFLNLEKKND